MCLSAVLFTYNSNENRQYIRFALTFKILLPPFFSCHDSAVFQIPLIKQRKSCFLANNLSHAFSDKQHT